MDHRNWGRGLVGSSNSSLAGPGLCNANCLYYFNSCRLTHNTSNSSISYCCRAITRFRSHTLQTKADYSHFCSFAARGRSWAPHADHLMSYSPTTLWIISTELALGSWILRISFGIHWYKGFAWMDQASFTLHGCVNVAWHHRTLGISTQGHWWCIQPTTLLSSDGHTPCRRLDMHFSVQL